MAYRGKLERKTVKCARDGCNNTFEIKVGAKTRQQKYCCSTCFTLCQRGTHREPVVRRRKTTKPVKVAKDRNSCLFSLQDIPNSYGNDGGKFAKTVNKILSGEVHYSPLDKNITFDG